MCPSPPPPIIELATGLSETDKKPLFSDLGLQFIVRYNFSNCIFFIAVCYVG